MGSGVVVDRGGGGARGVEKTAASDGQVRAALDRMHTKRSAQQTPHWVRWQRHEGWEANRLWDTGTGLGRIGGLGEKGLAAQKQELAGGGCRRWKAGGGCGQVGDEAVGEQPMF